MANMQAGQRLGKYRLIRQLGTGGFADVFLGEHQYLKHRVAIKVLTIPLNQKEADRFLQEARTMAALKHPHIVGCSDFDIEQGVPFLVMDYVPGGTLRDRHPEGTRVALLDVVNYVSQVADALQYAHDQKVMHLDVKPENMLLEASGTVLLSDFGLARFTHSVSGSRKLSRLVGTISYMAPEFIRGFPQAASDQYALAMVAYEWLVGTLPFSSSDERAVAYQHLNTPLPGLSDFDPSIPTAVDAVIQAALAKDPEERYPSVKEFADRLAQASTLTSVDESEDLTPEKPETLYKEGLRARGQGKLELAEQLLSQLATRAPNYRTNVVKEQLEQVRTARRPQLIAKYRTEADEANKLGAWDQEVAAWEHLLQLQPEQTEAAQARSRMRLAKRHKTNEHLYQDVAQMVIEENKEGAKLLLQQLWDTDSYYGDPAGLAKMLRMRAPQTYQQEKAQSKKEEARENRRGQLRRFRKRALGPQFQHQWIVSIAWALLLIGIGTSVGALTQSWWLSLAALAIAGGAGYFLGYRKGLDYIPLAISSAVSLVLTLALTIMLARLNYVQPIAVPYINTISTGLFTSKDVTEYHHWFLGRQLNFGLICGGITGLIAIIIAAIVRTSWGKDALLLYSSSRRKSDYLTVTQLIWTCVWTLAGGFALMAMIALMVAMDYSGFGWGPGQELMFLGFGLGSLLGAGIGTSIPIWWTAVTSWLKTR